MTVQSRGARSRRGGRGPGGMLLTALLVLAFLASSTLVFTDRVELLRLAVILALWAAVMAAFVTVIYRRQSDVAQARARDMKFVYDLQLDREISARREYELSVEARLRRQLSRESGEAADEMAALRAELSSLRGQLEVMLGTDLAPRPALESDRIASMPAAPGRVQSSRVTVVAEEIGIVAQEPDYAAESPIIDVSEEPLTPVQDEEPVAAPAPAPAGPPPRGANLRPGPGGANWRPRPGGANWRPQPPTEQRAEPHVPPSAQRPEAPWRPPEVRPGRPATGDRAQYPTGSVPAAPRGRHGVPPAPPPNPPAGRHRGVPEPVFEASDQQSAAQDAAVAAAALQEPAEPRGQHADGQSFADLMRRLQGNPPTGSGGRRRRQD